MRRAGRPARYVFGIWIGITLMISLAAAFAGLVLRGTGPAVRGTTEAFAAGAILALVAETMITESRFLRSAISHDLAHSSRSGESTARAGEPRYR